MAYRVPVLENFGFQPAVKAFKTAAELAALTATALKGDRYIVTDGSEAKKIAYCSVAGTTWSYDAPIEGMFTWVEGLSQYWHYASAAWAEYVGQQGPAGADGADGEKGDKGDQGDPGPGATYDSAYGCLIIDVA